MIAMNETPTVALAAPLVTRLRRVALRFAGGLVFFCGFVRVAAYLPMLALVMLGHLTPGLDAGPLETVPALAMLITAPLIGAGLMAAGVALRVYLGGADDLARFGHSAPADKG